MKAREFRIRLLNHVYILPHGRVTIGRNPASHIHLEGDLVSRDHAHLLIEGEGVSIVDEASENGVFVNGVRVEGSRALVHGDLLRVAFYDLHLEEQEKSGSDAETIQMVFCTECGAVLTPEMRFCTQCGARTRRYSKTESCSSCSATVTADMRFCFRCGHQLAKQDRRIRKEERLLAEFARRSGSKGDRDTER
jgi:RNA polymerase subunit RPABC4/transcription elongation factor Spt4